MLYKWEFQVEGKPVEVAINGDLTLDNDMLMIQAAQAGAGAALVMRQLVESHLANGSLVEILAEYATVPESFWLYYPSRKYHSAALRCFIEWVQQINRDMIPSSTADNGRNA